MDRRNFLQNMLLSISSGSFAAPLEPLPEFSSNPFTLGIASGDIMEDSVILWTRLAPDPLAADGGMPPVSVPVQWELATDNSMSRIVRQGETQATPALAHSVHIDIKGLEPSREYWYRFSVSTQTSPTGKTKTLPKARSHLDSIRFITASCQNYSHGFFNAYEHMVCDKPDFILHLGDYIYDTSFGETFRKHETEDAPVTLADYRRRHSLYKTDKHLQHAHSQIPFFTTIDNHDAIEDMNPDKFGQRMAAYQAWYEHMPVRGYHRVGDNHFDLYRKISLGNLAQISLLDSRQFRDKRELCTEDIDAGYGFGNYRERCSNLFRNDRTMLGKNQERWLEQNLTQHESLWNVIASPGPFLPFRYYKEGKEHRYIGAWDAYPANRLRVSEAMQATTTGHPLILSGDVHSFWAVDGALTTEESERIPVVEFVTSSISANWPPALAEPVTDNLHHNPQVRFYRPDKRGYLLHDVNPSQWEVTARAINDVRDEQSSAFNLASFMVTNGKSGFIKNSLPQANE
jgi:alkaline phosphatase D